MVRTVLFRPLVVAAMISLFSACARTPARVAPSVPTAPSESIAPVPDLPVQPRLMALPVLKAKRQGATSLYPQSAQETPGLANPAVTQQNLKQTICKSGWTKTIRPPSSYTTKLKKEQMVMWHLSGGTGDYEEDHFISLELGGDPRDPRNLWPEPYNPKPGARQKDRVDNFLHDEVCQGHMTLKEVQHFIVQDSYAIYLQIGAPESTGDEGDRER